MAKFEVELPKPGEKRTELLAQLPRTGRRHEYPADGGPPYSVRLFTEIGRAAAGCCVCDRTIPPGCTRFSLVVRLPEPATTKTGKPRWTSRYQIHTGCITKALSGEVKRSGDSCWDCGFPPDGGQLPHSVFTTSRFATARLCAACSDKPKWAQCAGCHVFFPHWMVSEIADDLEALAREAELADEPRFVIRPWRDGQREACEWCARRAGVRTVDVAEAEKAEFERLRAQVLERGIFDEDP